MRKTHLVMKKLKVNLAVLLRTKFKIIIIVQTLQQHMRVLVRDYSHKDYKKELLHKLLIASTKIN